MIAWVSELFEDVLGWIRGVQFAPFVVSVMAAHINGYTLHHWIGIPEATTLGGLTRQLISKQGKECHAIVSEGGVSGARLSCAH